jgi:hypothetical protein
MRPISSRFREALGTTHRRVTEFTCTVPGWAPVEIGQSSRRPSGQWGPGWTAGSVSCSGSSGARYSASFSIVPEPNADTYGMVSTPGAIFTVRHGIDFGGGDKELVECGVYEASDGGVSLNGGDISLSLVDLWQRLERCRFVTPYSPASGTRASRIAEAVSAAIPGVSIVSTATGGDFVAGENVWDRDRTAFITDMARDGSLDAHFDASGAFNIRAEPVLDATSPGVWTFSTGSEANIASADRKRPFDREYNTVVVQPIDDTQTWTQQVVPLLDTNHPRHASKIGVVPFFYRSPTIQSEEEAWAAGETIRERVLGTTETLSITGLSNPALEYGDNLTLLHSSTLTDPGFTAVHFTDSWQMDLDSGAMTAATRSSALTDVTEDA